MSGGQKKRLGIMAAITVLLGAAYFAEDRFLAGLERKAVNSEALQEETLLRLALAEEQIQSISFAGEEGEVDLVRDGDVWVTPADPGFCADPAVISRLLNDLTHLEADRVLEKQEDLSKFGLEPPAQTVTIGLGEKIAPEGDEVSEGVQDETEDTARIETEDEGERVQVYIGSRSDSSHALYAAISLDPDTVFLTKTALDEHFSGSLKDFALYEDMPALDAQQIRRIQVDKEEDAFTLVTPGDDTCTVTDAQGDTQSADVSIAGAVLQRLANMSWLNNLDYDAQGEDALEEYGLDQPKCKITVMMESEGTDVKAADGKDPATAQASGEEITFLVGEQDANGNYYVQLAGSSQVHSVRGEYLQDLIEGSARDFWSLSYSFVSISDLDHLEVTRGEDTWNLKRVAEDGKQDDAHVTWLVNEQEVSKELFTGFYYACVSVTAQERLAQVPEYAQEAATLTLRFYLTDDSVREMCYYPQDQNFYAVVYEEGTKAALVNRLYVEAMLEALEELEAAL